MQKLLHSNTKSKQILNLNLFPVLRLRAKIKNERLKWKMIPDPNQVFHIDIATCNCKLSPRRVKVHCLVCALEYFELYLHVTRLQKSQLKCLIEGIIGIHFPSRSIKLHCFVCLLECFELTPP